MWDESIVGWMPVARRGSPDGNRPIPIEGGL